MKVYLASWYASRDEMAKRAEELRTNGIIVTSRWLEETTNPTSQIIDLDDAFLRDTARIDIEDILLANVLVLNTPSETDFKETKITLSTWARGGRHFEAGLQYATMLFFREIEHRLPYNDPRMLVLVGHKENVFHYLDGVKVMFNLPKILHFNTWEEAKTFLISKSSKEEDCQLTLSLT